MQDWNAHVIALFLADNISVLSWMAHAGRTKKHQVRNLAQLHAQLLLHRNLQLQITATHILGQENREADHRGHLV